MQETWIELPSGTTPQSYTKTQPVKFEGRVQKYGPYTDVKPYTLSPIKVHYVNNAPFATFTQVLKEIEVSHWGNVAVEEQIDMAHTGAKLKGGFSRLDYQVGHGWATGRHRSHLMSCCCTCRVVHYCHVSVTPCNVLFLVVSACLSLLPYLMAQVPHFVGCLHTPTMPPTDVPWSVIQFPLLVCPSARNCHGHLLSGHHWQHLHVCCAGRGQRGGNGGR